MAVPEHIVIVGASAAGITAARTLRAQGWGGRLTLVGKEYGLPYDRPPLSKRLMSGQCAPEALNLITEDALKALNLEYLRGTSATGLDVKKKRLQLSNGEPLQFDSLLIATGCDARAIPGISDATNCFNLRNISDALAIREQLTSEKRLVLIGAGFIGTELAAVARANGCEVSIIDCVPVPLSARVGETVGKLIEKLHVENGVVFHNGRRIEKVTWKGGVVSEIILDNGAVLASDLIVVAIGAEPNAQWCEGLTVDGGVVCNAYCEAAPGIYVAGDAAKWFHPGYQEYMRIEHRTNAGEQAMVAAKNMLGARVEYSPLPFFWSDQYKVQIHSYGRIGAAYTSDIVGSVEDGSFVVRYHDGDTLVGVLAWNASRKAREYIEPLKKAWVSSSN